MIKFETGLSLKGNITIKDLLNNEGTLSFTLDKESLKRGGFLFSLIDNSNFEKFIFSFSIQDQYLVVQRSSLITILTLDDVPDKELIMTFLIWNYSELKLLCKYGSGPNDEKSVSALTAPILPPNTLISWARKQNLLPIDEYESEEEFRIKVHSCLQSIQDKINESGSYFQFWNIVYEGNKIIERKPKNEIEVQPIIHCMLSDQFLMSSIEIIPEYNSSVGNLDFLFIAKIKNQGFAYFCVEFKNAHSNKLEHGINVQLPTYMKSKNAKYGAYCVLDYRGEYFKEPIMDDTLDLYLYKKQLESSGPYINNIRLFSYELSKPISASKK